MFWLIALVVLFFVVIIAYFLLSGIAATTRDIQLMRSMNLQLEFLIDNSMAFNPMIWKRRECGTYLLTWLFPVLREDVRAISERLSAPLGHLYWWAFHFFYGLMRVKGAVVSSPRDVRALLGLQILAVRQGQ